MKIRFQFSILLVFVAVCVKSQTWIVTNPYVQSNYSNSYTTTNVEWVINTEEISVVAIKYRSRHNEPWISMSSYSYLQSNDKQYKSNIEGWGWLDNDNGFHKMKLNTKYNIKKGTTYTLCFIFSEIPNYSKSVNLIEDVNNGFTWKGISLNNKEYYDNPKNDDDTMWRPNRKYGEKNGNSSYNNRTFKGIRGNSNTSKYDNFVASASGTCFAISSDGLIVTCYHVIKDSHKYRIKGINGKFDISYKADLIATDQKNDLAILKIKDSRFTTCGEIPYAIRNSQLDVGERIFVLGYPLRAQMGDEIKFTEGVINALSGYQGDNSSYQYSAQVINGNSGGPLFDKNGNIVGVVNALLYVGASYAVKSSYLYQFISRELNSTKIPRQNKLRTISQTDKIKLAKKFVYIIEVE